MTIYTVRSSSGSIAGYDSYGDYDEAYAEALFWLGSSEDTMLMQIYATDTETKASVLIAEIV